jgi:hypothetical protein
MTKESARIQKSHSQERLEIQDSRESRPTTRDHEVVKMPDGREFISSPRTSLKRAGALSDLPQKAGFLRRWVSSNIPGRIQDLIDLGYRPATDENGIEIAPIRGGTNKQGETFMRYAMEISEEMNAKIERDKKIKSEANRQEHLDKMKGASLGFKSSTYIGQDTTKFVTKQN